jgi:hypothetical protein
MNAVADGLFFILFAFCTMVCSNNERRTSVA